jgi:ligand-binding sensor domain-containing protein
MKRAAGFVISMLVIVLLVGGFPPCPQPATAPSPDYVGALWIAGWRGIMKIAASDGSVLLSIRDADKVHAVAVDDRNGRVWTLGKDGLKGYGFDGMHLVTVPIREGCDHRRAVAVDPADGGVWIGARKTLYRLDGQGNIQVQLDLFRPIDGLVLDTVQSRLWVATGDAMTAYGETGSVLATLRLGRHEHVKALAFDAVSNRLCVAVRDELRRYDAQGALVSETRFRNIESIAVDTQGCLWAASDRSLARIDSSGQVLFEMRPFGWRGHGPIIDLAADSVDCSVWVLGNRLLSHVDVEGEILDLGNPDPGTGDGDSARALALYRDLTAPTLQITAPAHQSYVNSATPVIKLSYSDVGSGVAPSSLAITANGTALQGGLHLRRLGIELYPRQSSSGGGKPDPCDDQGLRGKLFRALGSGAHRRYRSARDHTYLPRGRPHHQSAGANPYGTSQRNRNVDR